jgi:tetratricopeptide (TPR) repeat protein
VDGIVEGTVMRSGQRVRISAQLVNAHTDAHSWAESYDRDLRDVLALQSEVAQAIAQEIRVKLTPVDQARFAKVHPVDPEAYEAYLKGRYHWNRRSGEGFGKAVQYFEEAIAKDPTYAAAYTGLADCLSGLGFWGFVSPDDGCGKAKALAQKALEMEHSSAEAHASLAFATTWYDYDLLAAEREFERSIELNPRYATAHQWLGVSLTMRGRHEEAFRELKQALRLDPLSIIINATLGMLYWCARQYDQAVEQYEKTLELEPNFALTHSVLGYAYMHKSMHERAISEMQKGVKLSHGAPMFVTWLGEAYAAAGYSDEAQKILVKLMGISRKQYVSPYFVGRIYAALRKDDEALRWLEAGYRERTAWMVLLKVEPRFDGLRSDPRFQDLLHRMNFRA